MCVEFMSGLLLETFGTECLSEMFGGSSFVRNRTENSVLQYRSFSSYIAYIVHLSYKWSVATTSLWQYL